MITIFSWIYFHFHPNTPKKTPALVPPSAIDILLKRALTCFPPLKTIITLHPLRFSCLSRIPDNPVNGLPTPIVPHHEKKSRCDIEVSEEFYLADNCGKFTPFFPLHLCSEQSHNIQQHSKHNFSSSLSLSWAVSALWAYMDKVMRSHATPFICSHTPQKFSHNICCVLPNQQVVSVTPRNAVN